MSQPNGEYLGIIKELAKCRDDDRLDFIQQKLQNVLNHDLIGSDPPKLGFCERYIRGDASLHIHGFLTINPCIGNGIEFCAIVNSNNTGVRTNGRFDSFFTSEASFGEVKVSVLVDVREVGEKSQHVSRAVTSVRLHSFNECKCLFGNPRKNMLERIVGRGFLGIVEPQREKAVLLPIYGELDVSDIELDQIERQVVDSRSQLIQSLARQDGDFWGRNLAHCYFLFAVRLRGSCVRITSRVVGDVLPDGFDVIRYPSEFKVGGINTIEHP